MSLDDFLSRVQRNIRCHGRSVVNVGSAMPFSYSIGNHLKNLPELLVFGLAPMDATGMINIWSGHMIDRAREFADGELIHIGGTFPCKAISCGARAREEYTLLAKNFLGHSDYRVMQIIAPDPNGRFPDDPSCEALYASIPILSPHRSLN